MAKSTGQWVVYKKRGVEYVHVSKRFATKQEAEEERKRLKADILVVSGAAMAESFAVEQN